MSEEIANPERLQIGTFDFSFALLFLLPLVLMILAFNIKSNEIEQGFMSLIEVQVLSKNSWIVARVGFYSFSTTYKLWLDFIWITFNDKSSAN